MCIYRVCLAYSRYLIDSSSFFTFLFPSSLEVSRRMLGLEYTESMWQLNLLTLLVEA